MAIQPYADFDDEDPAERLEGMELTDGWTVVRKIIKTPGSTGGNFSTGYLVVDSQGKEHFLKAIDFVRALRDYDPARAMERMVATFNFERDILQYCKINRMNRVVTAVHEGSVRVDGQAVQYLIFELADGDVRGKAIIGGGFVSSFAFRTLHEIASGLHQLHQHGIAHQDLKPSNVLIFRDLGSKLADLGRAASRSHNVPHDVFDVAGDPIYAPPENLYRFVDPDWTRRRCGCDAYLLGSMTAFMFTGTSITAEVLLRLDRSLRPQRWTGTYEQILPHLHGAFAATMADLEPLILETARADVVRVVKELCNPDPSLRGHPRTRRQVHGNPLSLERYVSEFDRLAIRAAIKERTSAQ